MTTMIITPEIVKQATSSGERYGSTDCSRKVYRVGDFVVKYHPGALGYRSANENEMANYFRIRDMLAEEDTYNGIKFGVPFMDTMTVPDVGEVMVCELIVGSTAQENQCCDYYTNGWMSNSSNWDEDVSDGCDKELCWKRIQNTAETAFGIEDMHYANWILRDGIVYMIDIES
jgi:hypothetical protein